MRTINILAADKVDCSLRNCNLLLKSDDSWVVRHLLGKLAHSGRQLFSGTILGGQQRPAIEYIHNSVLPRPESQESTLPLFSEIVTKLNTFST